MSAYRSRIALIVWALATGVGCQDTIPPSPTAPTGPCAAAAAPPVQYLISGTAHDTEGRPVEEVEIKGGVYITKCELGGFTVHTDAAGHFTGRLPAGTHSFVFTKPGYRIHSRDVVVTADTTVDEVMQPGVRISGMVSDAGLPVTPDTNMGVLRGATIEIVDGVNRGMKKTSGDPIGTRSNYFFDYVMPGSMRLRVTKEGYEPQERVITGLTDAIEDFELKWNYGSCLQSVAPVVFDGYSIEGGVESVNVRAAEGQNWTVSPLVPWLEVATSLHAGSQVFDFQIRPNPVGEREVRTGQLMIQCTNGGAQAITVAQDVDCGVTLTAAGTELFAREGGVGGVYMNVQTPGCRWKASSTVDWMHTVGVSSWPGQPPNLRPSPDLSFVVQPNPTGTRRVGYLLVSGARWQVVQQP